ncbi:MAG: hypothetical protein CL891_04715 [Dehalococcoidia bacterium]|nr:hypothetical protein [Dehalococcoidia bacterium]
MLGMAMNKLIDLVPTKKLPAFQYDHFQEELLQDMMAGSKYGNVYTWNPNKKIMTLLYPKRKRNRKS